MDSSTRRSNSSRLHSRAAVRIVLLLLPLAWAFMLNDMTAIEASRLVRIGLVNKARVFSLAPLPLLVLWIVCLQYWISYSKSSLGWACRLLGLYLVSLAMFGSFWIYAFRHTESIQIETMPGFTELLEIDNLTPMDLCWSRSGGRNVVLFDSRSPEHESILRQVLQDRGIGLR